MTDILPATHNSHENLSVCRNNNDSFNGSCLPTKQLIKIAKLINPNYNETNRSKLKQFIDSELKLTNKPEYLILGLKILNNLSSSDQQLIIQSFKPIGPVDYTWLSNFDIIDIFVRYEIDHPEFKFLGATYNDFLYYPHNNLYQKCKFIEKYKDKEKFGMIINQDCHNSGGSHWVALYFDLKGNIYYYDSVGRPPLQNVKDFIKVLINYFTKNDIKYNYKENKVEHQYGNSECGIYSSVFLIRVIENEENIDDIFNLAVNDETIHKFRRFLFNEEVN